MRAFVAAVFTVVVLAVPATGQTTTYIAFGDSITLGVGFDDCPCECAEECGYPWRLETMLRDQGRDAVVRNEGKGGEKTPEALSRIDSVLDEGGDVLLLMEGTNDVTRLISRETTIFNLNEIAERARARGVEPVHATVIPRTPLAPVDPDSVATRRLNWEIRELAFNRGREIADPYEAFISTPNFFQELYWQGEDPVGHPDPAGFDLMADVFFDVLTGVDSMPPVVGNVDPPYGAVDVDPETAVRLRLYDFGAGIDIQGSTLVLDGAPVSTNTTGDSSVLELVHRPAGGLQGVVDVGYDTRDLAAPANAGGRTVSTFTVAGTTFLEGDLDESGRVDGRDLILFAYAFGTSTGDLLYSIASDLDGNGVVDGEDLAILAANFGQSG